MAGVGFANVLDTYISPYNYTGTDFRLQRETTRMTKLMDGCVMNQTLIDVNCNVLQNHAGNVDAYSGGVRYSIGWLYACLPSKHSPFTFAFGPEASVYGGVVYVDRSGNNPAQAKADLTVNVTGMATCRFNVSGRDWQARYQMTVPVVGMAFSPNYGQSYYEAFTLGNYDHNIVFAYPGNMPSMRHRITLDIPVGSHGDSFRCGYVGQFNQSSYNNLRHHSYTHDFMIGFTKTFYRR